MSNAKSDRELGNRYSDECAGCRLVPLLDGGDCTQTFRTEDNPSPTKRSSELDIGVELAIASATLSARTSMNCCTVKAAQSEGESALASAGAIAAATIQINAATERMSI